LLKSFAHCKTGVHALHLSVGQNATAENRTELERACYRLWTALLQYYRSRYFIAARRSISGAVKFPLLEGIPIAFGCPDGLAAMEPAFPVRHRSIAVKLTA